MKPRGIRNNNPGNIRRDRTPWQGLAAEQTDPEFFTFETPEWGIRAMCRVLITYADKHRITRLPTAIRRWAPPQGKAQDGREYTQDTDAYTAHVARRTGLPTDSAIDLTSYDVLSRLVPAMILHECGQQPYSKRVIDRGLELAGVTPDRDPALQRPEGQAGAVVAGSATAATLAGAIETASPALPVVSALAEHAAWVIALGLLLGLGWYAYTRWADR